MSLSFDAPLWLIPVSIVVGFGLAALLYYREKSSGLSSSLKPWLFGLRFLSLTLLILLLLGPLLQISIQKEEKPIILVAIDNSFSMVSAKDSLEVKRRIPELLSRIDESLKQRFDLKHLLFGESVRIASVPDFNDRISSFSELFQNSLSQFSHNPAAMIIISDGMYNQGSNPVFDAAKTMLPVYTIATGDTNVYTDQRIDRVLHNRMAAPDTKIPIEIHVSAEGFKNRNSELKILENGIVKFSQTVQFPTEKSSLVIPISFSTNTVGLNRFTAVLSPVSTEKYLKNNRFDFYIDIAEKKHKILLLARAPHPDIQAIKSVIAENQTLELDISLVKDFKKPIADFDALIFHSLPSLEGVGNNYCSQALLLNIPAMYIIGNRTNYSAFNDLNVGLTISGEPGKTAEAQAMPMETFSSFAISPDLNKQLKQWPPLMVPSANYSLKPGSSILLMQKINGIETNRPLFVFSSHLQTQSRSVTICGEGLWWWRLKSFSISGNHKSFNELISKSVQYLLVKEQGGRFRVKGHSSVEETEPIVFGAELYNANYEPVNKPDIVLSLSDSAGKVYPFNFSRTGLFYSLEVGRLPSGIYRWNASTKLDDSLYLQSGFFTVKRSQIESVHSVANHQLMNQLAVNGGKMYTLENALSLPDDILDRSDIKRIQYTEKKYTDASSWIWLFIIIIALMSAEWALRRRGGTL